MNALTDDEVARFAASARDCDFSGAAATMQRLAIEVQQHRAARPVVQPAMPSVRHLDVGHFLALRPDARDPRVRLRLECERDDLTVLVEERVMAEDALTPRPQRARQLDSIWFTPDDIDWLHAATSELRAERSR